jgi:hypothetical protein
MHHLPIFMWTPPHLAIHQSALGPGALDPPRHQQQQQHHHHHHTGMRLPTLPDAMPALPRLPCPAAHPLRSPGSCVLRPASRSTCLQYASPVLDGFDAGARPLR